MVMAPFIGMPLPLLPLQILWINLLTDGLPAVALAVEPPERNIMKRPPFHPNESIFSRGIGFHIIWVGLAMGIISLAMGWWYYTTGREDWQTMVFTVLTFSQIAHVLAIRSGWDSLFRVGLMSNKALLGAAITTVLLQFAVVYIPFLQGLFNTVSLPWNDLVVSLLLSSIIFWIVEIEKWVYRTKIYPQYN
jgi:Ca2+-transporting ATPase